MAIVNITPDSFFDGGKNDNLKSILKNCTEHLQQGAKILDIGGQSTRPGAERISAETEMKRVIPAIEAINKEFPDAIISVDTFYAKVAKHAIQAGATMVNDISAGSLDDEMLKTVLSLNVPYVASHIRGNPQNMQNDPSYSNVVTEVYKDLSSIKKKLRSNGFKDLLIDPGFGFGKTKNQNFELLANLDHFQNLACPILVGLSRKSMIWKTLKSTPSEALNGTTALNAIALLKGANILRVHDVKEASEVIKLSALL